MNINVRVNITSEQVEKIREISDSASIALKNFALAISRAIDPLFIKDTESIERISRKYKRREKYLRRYEWIGKKMRKQ